MAFVAMCLSFNNRPIIAHQWRGVKAKARAAAAVVMYRAYQLAMVAHVVCKISRHLVESHGICIMACAYRMAY